MKIAVIGVQGAVSEHIEATRRAMQRLGLKASVEWVRERKALEGSDAAIIPGGESTTISRLLEENGMLNVLKGGIPIMGTCAGMVLLAKMGDEQVKKTKQKLLERMDFQVNRNAFGRQRESFEADVGVSFLDKPFHAVFIRSPTAEKVWGGAKVVATYGEQIVGVEQEGCLALSFHPELSGDTRVHEYFLKKLL